MNEPKYKTTQRIKKKIAKELRVARPPRTEKEVRGIGEVLAPYPAPVQQHERALLQASQASLNRKKSRSSPKVSKRTTPGRVKDTTPPQSIHVEGTRWIKTLQRQAGVKRRVSQKQALKRKT